jgi:transcriptional regulator with XRE-family HTH domain
MGKGKQLEDQSTDVGQRIADARRASGLSQRALAERLGISLGQLDAWEVGRSDPSSELHRVAEATGRSERWLQSREEGHNPDELTEQGDDQLLADLGRRIPNEAVDTEVADEAPAAERDLPVKTAPAEVAKPDELPVDAEPDDELDRLFASLARQRDDLKQRHVELDERAQELDSRWERIQELENVIRERQELSEREWERSLRTLEELHRNVVESASGFADRAADLLRGSKNQEEQPG